MNAKPLTEAEEKRARELCNTLMWNQSDRVDVCGRLFPAALASLDAASHDLHTIALLLHTGMHTGGFADCQSPACVMARGHIRHT